MSKSVAFAQNWGILQTRIDQRGGDHIKMNFDYFQTQRWMLQTAEKVDEKNGVICLVSQFPSWVIVLKLSRKVHFSQFCADFGKKSKPIKTIYINAFESSPCTLSDYAMVCTGLSHCSWYISD